MAISKKMYAGWMRLKVLAIPVAGPFGILWSAKHPAASTAPLSSDRMPARDSVLLACMY